MNEFFTVRCTDCRKTVRIDSVSVCDGDSYSYGYRCACGAALEVDGASGEGIPESMKADARQRRRAHEIANQVDYERRALPPSAAKTRLKASRFRMPIEQPDKTWLVYQLDDGRRVYFAPDGGGYILDGSAKNRRDFNSVGELAEHLQ